MRSTGHVVRAFRLSFHLRRLRHRHALHEVALTAAFCAFFAAASSRAPPNQTQEQACCSVKRRREQEEGLSPKRKYCAPRRASYVPRCFAFQQSGNSSSLIRKHREEHRFKHEALHSVPGARQAGPDYKFHTTLETRISRPKTRFPVTWCLSGGAMQSLEP